MDSRSREAAFAIGFAIGITIGISVAFMLTPHSGAETREVLKDKALDLRGRVREVTGNRRKIYTDAWREPKVKPYATTFD